MDSVDISELLKQYNLSDCWSWTETQLEVAKQSMFWFEGVVQLVLTIIGLLTTSLSIFILSRKDLLRHTFNQLLIALAVFDTIYLLFMMIESLGWCFSRYGDSFRNWRWFKNLLTPYFLYPVKAMAMTGSIFMMMAVATERYIAVYHPFSRIPSHFQSSSGQRRSGSLRLAAYLSPVILLSVLLNLSLFFESEYTGEPPHYIAITPFRFNHNYLIVRAWGRLLLLSLIPFVVTSILNYKIYQVIRRTSSGSFCRGDDTPSIILFFIVIIFLMSSIPRNIIYMQEATKLSFACSMMGGQPFSFWDFMLVQFYHIFLVLNPFLNFIVYCFVGKNFRRLTIFHFGSRCWNKPQIPPMSSARKNTLITQC